LYHSLDYSIVYKPKLFLIVVSTDEQNSVTCVNGENEKYAENL